MLDINIALDCKLDSINDSYYFRNLKQRSERAPSFDPTMAAAALGQYLPLALQNGGLNAIPQLNSNTTLPENNYPFPPLLRHLSSFAPKNLLEAANILKSNIDSNRKSQHEDIAESKINRLHEGSEISRPIDLSSSTTFCDGSTGNSSNLDTSRSDINEDEDDENVDVLSIDPPASPSDIEQWSVDSVVEFVSNVESCQDYQDVSNNLNSII